MARAVRPKGLDRDPWPTLEALEPDVALLQEAQEPPTGFGGYFHLNRTRRGWGTAIWSRYELRDTTAIPSADGQDVDRLMPALKGYVAAARIQITEALRMAVISIHAYPAAVRKELLAGLDPGRLKTPSATAVWPGDLIWWLTRSLPANAGASILGGDWNTSRLFDEIYGPRGNQEFFDRMARAVGMRP